MKYQKSSYVAIVLCCIPLLMNGQSLEKEYRFPVKAGTPEWKSLKTRDARFNAYNIPEKALKNMSTTALVNACLKYPEWGQVMTRNSIQEGYDYLKSKFNGFAELESRSDAGVELLKVYNKMNPGEIKQIKKSVDRGQYSFDLMYVQLLLAQYPIVTAMDADTKDLVLTRSLEVYDSLSEYPENYGYQSKTRPVLVMGRILNVQEAQERQANKQVVSSEKAAVQKSADFSLRAFVDGTETPQEELVNSIVAETRAKIQKSIK